MAAELQTKRSQTSIMAGNAERGGNGVESRRRERQVDPPWRNVSFAGASPRACSCCHLRSPLNLRPSRASLLGLCGSTVCASQQERAGMVHHLRQFALSASATGATCPGGSYLHEARGAPGLRRPSHSICTGEAGTATLPYLGTQGAPPRQATVLVLELYM